MRQYLALAFSIAESPTLCRFSTSPSILSAPLLSAPLLSLLLCLHPSGCECSWTQSLLLSAYADACLEWFTMLQDFTSWTLGLSLTEVS